ncbi:MAG: Gfo/Idh/MocA family oxidoreductase [Acidimicrobiales bacterium]
MSGTNGKAPARLAAVGLGRWARIMASAYYKSDVVELVSCFSRNAERRGQFAADYGCAEDESLEALLARDDVDGLVVTVPNDQHAPVIEAAARAGKHVYVEKPVAVEVEHIKRIQVAVGEAGIVFACGHSARRLAGVREMRRCLDSGEIGTPSMVEAVFSNERGLELKEGDWRGDPAQSPGGPLTQLGIHQIDNLNFLFGVPNRVVGFGRKGAPVANNTMVVGALLEYDDVIGFLGNDWLTPGAFTMDLYCTKARLRYELDFSWWSDSADTDAHARLIKVQIESDSDDPDARILSERPVQLSARDHLREEIEEFALAIRGEAEVEVGMSVAVANVAVVLATARAIDQRRAVDVAEVQSELRI